MKTIMRTSAAKSRGSLLIVTLWVVVILSALAVAIGRYLSLQVRLAKYRSAQEEARTLARSGIYLAMQRLIRDAQEPEANGATYDWLGDDWAVFSGEPADHWVVPLSARGGVLPRGQVDIEIADAERGMDVNAASASQLDSLIRETDVANAIMDYRDADQDGPGDRFVDQPPYVPKNGPVAALEELRDVPGQSDETFERLRQFTWAAPELAPTQSVNINTAPREVLIAAGLPTLADTIIAFRNSGHAFAQVTPTLQTDHPAIPPPFDSGNLEFLNAQPHLTVSSQTFRVTATGRLRQPQVRYRIEAIVRRNTTGASLIAWREG